MTVAATERNDAMTTPVVTTSSAYRDVRSASRRIAAPLHPEDCVIQSMPDASPVRWHLAHTTWFFETFLLKPVEGYRPVHPDFEYLFNSYYNAVGVQYPRDRRGLLSRPTMDAIWDYREEIDRRMVDLIDRGDFNPALLAVGLNHEQQHQELMLTDVKHMLGCNCLYPAMFDRPPAVAEPPPPGRIRVDQGIRAVGGPTDGFSFDNEHPRHQRLVHGCEIDTRLTTNGEYLTFVEDGGYDRPDHWLSAGWATVADQDWRQPLAWVRRDDRWFEFTLSGLIPLDPDGVLTHVSYFEADAYARWRGATLPTETQWETAVADDRPEVHRGIDRSRNYPGVCHPTHTPPPPEGELSGVFGGVWQWTRSDYDAYPGYRPPPGAVGEYNGKFMCGCYVLRGGSCATPPGHSRSTYRNFFHPAARWQFAGIRLAWD